MDSFDHPTLLWPKRMDQGFFRVGLGLPAVILEAAQRVIGHGRAPDEAPQVEGEDQRAQDEDDAAYGPGDLVRQQQGADVRKGESHDRLQVALDDPGHGEPQG